MSGALRGKVIVNTRAAHQADALNMLLRERGAVPLDYPSIAIIPPVDVGALDAALIDLVRGCYDWLVLTSSNTVQALAERLSALALTLRGRPVRAAAVGKATAEAARAQLGLEAVDVPPQYVAESLAAHLPIEAGTRVLLPESAIARPTLAERLSARGASVHVVEAYQTVCAQGEGDFAARRAQQQIDALTFTSASTVNCFLERLAREGGRREDALRLCAACIGAKTAAAAHACGFRNVIVASDHTLHSLLDALEAV